MESLRSLPITPLLARLLGEEQSQPPGSLQPPVTTVCARHTAKGVGEDGLKFPSRRW